MCGIVGIIGQQDPQWIESMNAAQIHRGPDDFGVYQDQDNNVSVGMRRLSILDLSGGHQPMFNEDRSICIVFNGEIFNAPALRAKLEDEGLRFFTSNSDTEVILKLYEKKGVDCVGDFNGMFAFVVYDKKKKILFGARDQVGIKPLYYTHQSGRFSFASELKSILQLPFITRDINFQSLYHYMTLLYVPDQDSIIRDIFRLPPGHFFIKNLQNQEFSINEYWKLKFDSTITSADSQELKLELRRELRESVARWTLSDVPIACSLSGGIDSSSIIGLLAENGLAKVKTYSLGFEGEAEQEFDELHLARKSSERWGTDHHEIILKPNDLLSDLIEMVWHLDEPYAGGLPSWYVYKYMGKDVKVGLTGTGGDELFGNYGKWKIHHQDKLTRYSLDLRNKSIGGPKLLGHLLYPFAAAGDFLPTSVPFVGRNRMMDRLATVISEPFGTNYYAQHLYLSDDAKRDFVFNKSYRKLSTTSKLLQNLYDSYIPVDVRNGMAAVDFKTQLPEEFLFMTDRFSMAHHLEARVPFLDQQLISFVLNIDPAIRTSSNDLKYLLKMATQDLLPEELLSAPKKGFVIPVEFWIRGELKPLVQKLINPERLKSQGIFKPEFYEKFVVPHLNQSKKYTWQIWAMLMFQLWYNMFIENNQISKPSYSWHDL